MQRTEKLEQKMSRCSSWRKDCIRCFHVGAFISFTMLLMHDVAAGWVV